MSGYKEKIEEAVSAAIENKFEIFNRQNHIYERLKCAGNICIFGIGGFFEDCAKAQYLPFSFQYVSDNNPKNWGNIIRGVKCIPPEDLVHIPDLIVIIMVSEYREILKQLEKLNIECYPFEYLHQNVYDEHYAPEWFEKQRANMLSVIDILEDEKSKEVYTQVLCNRLNIQEHCCPKFNDIRTQDEYFTHGIFHFSDDEYFVDAGAYIGDSLEQFMRTTNNKCGKIYCFEMDHYILEQLKVCAKQFDTDCIEIYPYGVSNKHEVFPYEGYGLDGALKNPQDTAEVVALDEVLCGKKVTFIKMDIEGFELNALKGAEQIIQTQLPKLAISAYHRLFDLWEIPLYIKKINAKYKIYFRHHSPIVWDTDCYAYCEK